MITVEVIYDDERIVIAVQGKTYARLPQSFRREDNEMMDRVIGFCVGSARADVLEKIRRERRT